MEWKVEGRNKGAYLYKSEALSQINAEREES
jgi:hypothetical protein